MISDQQRKLIQCAKRDLGMSDAVYRAMLQRVAGVDSSKKLDQDSVTAVIAEFKRLGFKYSQDEPRYGEREGFATPHQISKIRALFRNWATNKDKKGLRHFMEHKFHISDLRFLDSGTASKVIFALERMVEQRNASPARKPISSNPTTREREKP